VSTELATQPIDATTVARVLLHGDLRQLNDAQKVSYYKSVCDSVGLNPLTQPFAYIVMPQGKEVLYAKREATEQLRFLHSVSIDPKTFTREVIEGVYIVTASASLPAGRTDVSTGAVWIDGLKGEARANAMMKAETKAKRRVTLSICGLGMLDETEVADLAAAKPIGPAAPERPTIAAALEPDPVDEPPAPDGFVRVMLIEDTPTSNPNVIRFTITLSDGLIVTTVNNWLASLAQTALERRTLIQVKTKPSRYGNGTDLAGITEYAPPPKPEPKPEPTPEPAKPASLPLTAEDIPF